MGNKIASSFVQSLRQSLSGSTVFSQTSANTPLFVDPTSLPGVARAWVSFNGMAAAGTVCEILNKSSNVVAVTSRGMGDYRIGLAAGTFKNNAYLVTGVVASDSRVNLTSAANSFFVMMPGYKTPSVLLNTTQFGIQTLYNTASAGALYQGPAFARRVDLLIYK